MKLSTNSLLSQKMPDIIDIDTGPVISGHQTIQQMGEKILDLVVQFASGETRTESRVVSPKQFYPMKKRRFPLSVPDPFRE